MIGSSMFGAGPSATAIMLLLAMVAATTNAAVEWTYGFNGTELHFQRTDSSQASESDLPTKIKIIGKFAQLNENLFISMMETDPKKFGKVTELELKHVVVDKTAFGKKWHNVELIQLRDCYMVEKYWFPFVSDVWQNTIWDKVDFQWRSNQYVDALGNKCYTPKISLSGKLKNMDEVEAAKENEKQIQQKKAAEQQLEKAKKEAAEQQLEKAEKEAAEQQIEKETKKAAEQQIEKETKTNEPPHSSEIIAVDTKGINADAGADADSGLIAAIEKFGAAKVVPKGFVKLLKEKLALTADDNRIGAMIVAAGALALAVLITLSLSLFLIIRIFRASSSSSIPLAASSSDEDMLVDTTETSAVPEEDDEDMNAAAEAAAAAKQAMIVAGSALAAVLLCAFYCCCRYRSRRKNRRQNQTVGFHLYQKRQKNLIKF